MIEQICLDKVLLEGAKEVFETMVFMEIEQATEQDNKIEGWALLGSITFKGFHEGCLAICCGVDCAKAIAVNMLALDYEEVGEEETCDAMGEVVNMVMGSVKSRIQDEFGNLEVSIPSVVSGRQLQNNFGKEAVKLAIEVYIGDEYLARLILSYRESKVTEK